MFKSETLVLMHGEDKGINIQLKQKTIYEGVRLHLIIVLSLMAPLFNCAWPGTSGECQLRGISVWLKLLVDIVGKVFV